MRRRRLAIPCRTRIAVLLSAAALAGLAACGGDDSASAPTAPPTSLPTRTPAPLVTLPPTWTPSVVPPSTTLVPRTPRPTSTPQPSLTPTPGPTPGVVQVDDRLIVTALEPNLITGLANTFVSAPPDTLDAPPSLSLGEMGRLGVTLTTTNAFLERDSQVTTAVTLQVVAGQIVVHEVPGARLTSGALVSEGLIREALLFTEAALGVTLARMTGAPEGTVYLSSIAVYHDHLEAVFVPAP